MAIRGVTFWGHALRASQEMQVEARQIEDVLFGEAKPIDIAGVSDNTQEFAVWINRICDVQTMWCHLKGRNEVFVTSDRNFRKATKLPRLLSLGAGDIRLPEEL
jgi:hypothetical protein